MRLLHSNALEHPCRKDCPNRFVGCVRNCEAWSEYEKKRNQMYQDRLKERESEDRTRGARDRQNRFLKKGK